MNESTGDGDWKKNVGFPINYESGASSDDEFGEEVVLRHGRNIRSARQLLEDGGNGAVADLLGTTPPRARIRDKEKRRSIILDESSGRMLRDNRRNTIDNFFEPAATPDTPDRSRKRLSLKIARSKERDSKMLSERDRYESLPSPGARASMTTFVESCSRFMSLSSRLKCNDSTCAEDDDAQATPLPRSRVDFHNTFSLLINMGNVEKGRRTLSREEQVWQNELKDLIWLELQARIAGRSLAEQDAFICAQRRSVATLIDEIINYRFEDRTPCENQLPVDGNSQDQESYDPSSPGCLSFNCTRCSLRVGSALKQTRNLLDALDAARRLYPSYCALANDATSASTKQFDDKLKAMCLWYNVTHHLRVKLLLFRRMVRAVKAREEVCKRQQETSPNTTEEGESSSARICTVRFDCVSSNDGSNLTNSDESHATDNDNREGQKISEKETAEGDNQEKSTDEVDSTTDKPYEKPWFHGDPTKSADSGYTSTSEASISPYNLKEDVYELGSLEELTVLRLLNKCEVSPYRYYLHDILKTQGVRRSTMFIHKMEKHILNKTHMTLESPVIVEPALFTDSDAEKNDPQAEREESDEFELRRYGWWSPERISMCLPSYCAHFLLLSTVCMEVVVDFLRLRLTCAPVQPSCFTLHQINHELREGLDIAREVRSAFSRDVAAALRGRGRGAGRGRGGCRPGGEPGTRDLTLVANSFDDTVHDALKQYLTYMVLRSREKVLTRAQWESEWTFTSLLVERFPKVRQLVVDTHVEVVCNQIEFLRSQFHSKFQDLDRIEEPLENDEESRRQFAYEVCRRAQNICSCQREATLQAVQSARRLAHRLPASPTHIASIYSSLMCLRADISSMTLTVLARSREGIANYGAVAAVQARCRELLLQMFNLCFELHKELYTLCLAGTGAGGTLGGRRSRPYSLPPPPAGRAARARRPGTVIVNHSVNPILIHKELHRFVNEVGCQSTSAAPSLANCRGRPAWLRSDSVTEDDEGLRTCHQSSSIELLLTGEPAEQPTNPDPALYEATIQAQAKFAAEVARAIIDFAKSWMEFVVDQCERGRGLRPRWASQGLEFLMLACDPHNTMHLSDEEFEKLKQMMDGCISHVIGSRPATPRVETTPTARRHRMQSPLSANSNYSGTSSGGSKSPNPFSSQLSYEQQSEHSVRVSAACAALEQARHSYLVSVGWAGRVSAAVPRDLPPRQLAFKWQRGLKVGQGTFGKVYTVINTETGQLLAMKEIAINPNDRRSLQRAANELKLLETTVHSHLVRYYGCELHREKMLIFMELCVEGSLEALIATTGALPEHTIRRYTRQLVSAVVELHDRMIVHRDIKSGNIFLTNEGHCLKLGDFGSAVRLRASHTAIGELQGAVGTQAYMAPEVFMNPGGHGRAADIWSLGCVVTEMASGKRPFSEYDNNYQIMFVVGMGGAPEVPPSLSDEGASFCSACLQHQPTTRPKARELAHHNFLNMSKSDDDCPCEASYLKAK